MTARLKALSEITADTGDPGEAHNQAALIAATRQSLGQIGDGAVVYRDPATGGWAYPFWPQRGEYAGALELTFAAGFGVKAIALITTRRPDGSPGWSFLLMIYAQFSVHIAFGIFLTGVGGMIGLHHGVDIPALTAGMKTGVLISPCLVVSTPARSGREGRSRRPARPGSGSVPA